VSESRAETVDEDEVGPADVLDEDDVDEDDVDVDVEDDVDEVDFEDDVDVDVEDDVDEVDVDVEDDVEDGDDDDLEEDDLEDDANLRPGTTAADVLEYLVKALVEDPAAVDIDTRDDRRGLRLQVSVGPGDMGRVIGRRGRIANAIRTVVRAAAAADGVAVDVDFVD
jgi:predicted RNA-binding protein YlqC (UPF0109 family)